MKPQKQMSDTFLIGALLAVVGGFLDVYTYMCRGGVFANAQTGNIVLMGIQIAQGNWVSCVTYMIPIFFFVLGVLLSETIGHRCKQIHTIHWRQIILLLEILVLVAVSLIPIGKLNILANSLVSFTCALQVQSFRKFNGKAYASTMCTGNLRSATEQFFAYFVTKEPALLRQSLQYYGICGVFILGAVLGMLLTRLFAEKVIAVAWILLGVVFAILFIRSE